MAITRPEYILAIEQSTTATRAVLFNQAMRQVVAHSVPLTSITPHPEWDEQRPAELWSSTQIAITNALIEGGITAHDIKAIGIANQRETTIIWDKHTGQPIYNAINWSSRQSQAVAQAWYNAGHETMIREKTGLPISPYFSATKIRWILDHVPSAQAKADAGDLLFGTVDTWLTWQLTNRTVHATDATNASRTMLFNLENRAYDNDLLDLFNIPASMLPKVYPSSGMIAETDPSTFFGAEVPITALIGDQNAALIGLQGFAPGDVKSSYGTGAFLLMNTGNKLVASTHNLISTIAYQVDERPVYALEGAVFSAGSAVNWLHEQLHLVHNLVDVEKATQQATPENAVYFVPAFHGLGAPYWDPHAQAAMLGATRGTTKNDLIAATLQAIAYQTTDILTLMAQESGLPNQPLKADGPLSRSAFLMQQQANLANRTIERAYDEQVTALGAAFLAGLAIGYWHDLNDLSNTTVPGRQFTPALTDTERDHALQGWHKAVRATQAFEG